MWKLSQLACRETEFPPANTGVKRCVIGVGGRFAIVGLTGSEFE